MKVIANLSVSAPTNLTVCGNFTFLMAMWSEGGCKCMWTLFLWHVCVADRPGWTLWSIDSVPGGLSRPQICILGFSPCPEGVLLQAEGGSKLISPPSTWPLSHWLTLLAAANLSTNGRRESAKRGVACAGWCVARGSSTKLLEGNLLLVCTEWCTHSGRT